MYSVMIASYKCMMSIFNIFFIVPLNLLYEVIFTSLYDATSNYGVSIILLSFIVNVLALPLYYEADLIQDEERKARSHISKWEQHIKKHFRGDEKYLILQTYYRQCGYRPYYAMRSALPLLLQIPLFISAYRYISGLKELKGISFIGISDLGSPDGLLHIGLYSINLLPVIMTIINLCSAAVYLGDRDKKEKIQSCMIALIFLIILYKSPAGLVIYWIFNQLFSVIKNVFGRYLKSRNFDIKNIFEYVGKKVGVGWKELYPVLFFLFTLFVYAPAEIYLKNSQEFWFTYIDMCSVFAEIAIIGLLVLLWVLYRFPRFITIIHGVLLGVALMSFVQGNVLPYDYGVLDGTAIDWSRYEFRSIYNTIIWALVVISVIVIFCKNNKALSVLIWKLSYVVLFIQVITLAIGMSGVKNTVKDDVNGYISTQNEFNISSKKNTIVLVLDAFDSGLMQDLIMEYPQEVEQALCDFTYYPDTVGASGNTSNSVPIYLSGIVNDASKPLAEYMNEAYANSPLVTELSLHDYNSGFYLTSHLVAPTIKPAADNYKVQRIKVNGQLGIGVLFMKLTAFKYMPHVLKPLFWMYTGQFSNMKLIESTDVYNTSNFIFYDKIQNEGFSLDSEKECFRYIHINGTHVPYNMNENCEYLPDGDSTEVAQARGCLKMVKMFCDSLKSCGAYDNAAIIIMADHGWTRQMHQNPLFMIKQRGDDGNFMQSEASLSFLDLPRLLCDLLHDDRVDISKYDRDNRFYYDTQEIKGVATQIEYRVIGPAYGDDLQPTGRVFRWKYR
ncbi:MAG: YidC/Oxa1 family membrane protein insertase [Lachnospiraceae bacterium]|nr:YidC/Oxa1 family membrane protein insertase [Lachnospiraceae bacterium]